MVGCFILGSGIVFNFEISQYGDFTQLKKAIWEEDKDYFESVGIKNEKRFKLWKVRISTKNNNKYDELLDNHPVDLDVKKCFDGKRLDETWRIDSIFESPPPEEHIHIMVQPPPSSATTGKCLPMVYLSNKKFALSHILYFFIRSGKRRHRDSYSDEESRTQKKERQTRV